ncbi:hypothetical protein AAKU55_005471 [Oxalobacteraceae bacterium GrIS 1.11]
MIYFQKQGGRCWSAQGGILPHRYLEEKCRERVFTPIAARPRPERKGRARRLEMVLHRTNAVPSRTALIQIRKSVVYCCSYCCFFAILLDLYLTLIVTPCFHDPLEQIVELD